MPNKIFMERLNSELDEIDIPKQEDERIDIFAKLIKIPRFKAYSIINGTLLPDTEILTKIAEELEVNPDWLVGKTDRK